MLMRWISRLIERGEPANKKQRVESKLEQTPMDTNLRAATLVQNGLSGSHTVEVKNAAKVSDERKMDLTPLQEQKAFHTTARSTEDKDFSVIYSRIQQQVKELSSELKHQFDSKSELDPNKLEEWLRLTTVLNMHRVCDAFYRGSLFYSNDPEANKGAKEFKSGWPSITTLSELEPVVYDKNDGIVHLYKHQFKIKQHAQPSRVLTDLLFSFTSSDCSASIEAANYLTIFDLLHLIHGNDKGTLYFDRLFGAKPSDSHFLNRMRIGVGYIFHPGDPDYFNPLWLFKRIEKFNFDEIYKNPSKFLGVRIGIEGHPKYLQKHPEGFSQAWNVIVAGVNSNNEPLFLLANDMKKPYLMTLDGLLEMLAYNYNLFPDKYNSLVKNFSQKDDMTGCNGWLTTYKVEAVMLLVNNFDKLMKEMQALCDKHDRALQSESTTEISKPTIPYFSSENIIKYAQDDCCLYSPHFYRRKDIKHRHTVDDDQLHIGYQQRANQRSKK